MSYFCYQGNDEDCGYCALKMMLASAYKDKRFLYLLKNDKKSSYTFSDLEMIAMENGMKLKSYVYDEHKPLKGLPKKFMAAFRGRNKFHMVYVERKGLFFMISDGARGKYLLGPRGFMKRWARITMEPSYSTKKTPNYLKVKLTYPIFALLTGIIETISTFFLLLGFFYLNESSDPLIPIALLITFSLLEIISSSITSLSLKKFDKEHLFVFQDNFTKDRYILYQNYKALSLTKTKRLYSALLISLLIITMIAINDFYALLGALFTVLLVLLERVTFLHYISKKEEVLETKESLLFLGQIKKSAIIDELYSLSKDSVSYRRATAIWRYLITSLLVALSIVIYLISKDGDSLSFSSLFYLFFLYRTLYKNLRDIIAYPFDKKREEKLKFRFIDEFY